MSNIIRTQLKTVAAMAHSRACRVLGELLPFVHIGAAAVNLYVMPLSRMTTYGPYQTTKSESKKETFEFAKQTGFDGAAGSVRIGDSFTYNGEAYRVLEVEDDDYGIFKAKCEVKTARQI